MTKSVKLLYLVARFSNQKEAVISTLPPPNPLQDIHAWAMKAQNTDDVSGAFNLVAPLDQVHWLSPHWRQILTHYLHRGLAAEALCACDLLLIRHQLATVMTELDSTRTFDRLSELYRRLEDILHPNYEGRTTILHRLTLAITEVENSATEDSTQRVFYLLGTTLLIIDKLPEI